MMEISTARPAAPTTASRTTVPCSPRWRAPFGYSGLIVRVRDGGASTWPALPPGRGMTCGALGAGSDDDEGGAATGLNALAWLGEGWSGVVLASGAGAGGGRSSTGSGAGGRTSGTVWVSGVDSAAVEPSTSAVESDS